VSAHERICPHCGYDLVIDAPVILNDFSMLNSLAPLYYRGQVIRLTPAERCVAWTLIKAFPRAVRLGVILDRLGSDAEGNVIDVYLSRIRKKLRDIGAPIPFESAGGKLGERAVTWKLS
jgi:DNA-binding response OmpR family regulator